MSSSLDELNSRVRITPYEVGQSLAEFDCGKTWFNDFVNTDEIDEYHKEQLGLTRLVYYEDEFAGYFSLSANALRDSDFEGDEWANGDQLSGYPYDIPAYLLGHLAVDNEYKGMGLGEFLLKRVIARTLKADIPFRILLLHAHEDVVEFYERYDFVASEAQEGYPKLMFMDLADIGGDLSSA